MVVGHSVWYLYESESVTPLAKYVPPQQRKKQWKNNFTCWLLAAFRFCFELSTRPIFATAVLQVFFWPQMIRVQDVERPLYGACWPWLHLALRHRRGFAPARLFVSCQYPWLIGMIQGRSRSQRKPRFFDFSNGPIKGKCGFLANASFGLAFWAFFHGKGVFLSFVGLLSSATCGSSFMPVFDDDRFGFFGLWKAQEMMPSLEVLLQQFCWTCWTRDYYKSKASLPGFSTVKVTEQIGQCPVTDFHVETRRW